MDELYKKMNATVDKIGEDMARTMRQMQADVKQFSDTLDASDIDNEAKIMLAKLFLEKINALDGVS